MDALGSRHIGQDVQKTSLDALIEAASLGDNAMVMLMLERGARGKTAALENAILLKRGPVARLLLEWGANPSALSRNAQELVYLAGEGDEDLVRLFIEHGADLNVVWRGRTPLQAAHEEGHTNIVELLESARTDEDSADDSSSYTDTWENIGRTRCRRNYYGRRFRAWARSPWC